MGTSLRRVLGAFIGGLLVVLMLAAPVHAQQPGGGSTWSIQTAAAGGADARGRFDLEVQPGETVRDHVSVRNLGTERLSLDLYASDAVATQDGSFNLLPANATPVDVGSWISMGRQTVSLAAGESTVVPFTLTIPAGASPGDHAGGIVASLSQEGGAGANRVRIDYRVGVRVYLRVGGALAPQLQIHDVRVTYAHSLNPIAGGTATVSYELRNTGNVRLASDHTVRLFAPLGVLLATQSEAVAEVLPGQSRRVEMALSAVPLLRLRAEVAVTPRLASGAAVTEVGVLSASSMAWSPPWPQMLLVFIIGALIETLVRAQRARLQRARIASAFSASEVAELVRRLNADYTDELLLIGRQLASGSVVTSVVIATIDRKGADLFTIVDGVPSAVRLPWGTPVDTHEAVEERLRNLAREAAAAASATSLTP